MYPDAIYIDRLDLLTLPYFWRGLFAMCLQATVDDPFVSATRYFGFRCSDKRPKAFVADHESLVPKEHSNSYVAHFVYVRLANGWRVGRSFHNCPEDNQISFDLVSPDKRRVELGSDYGHFMLPALRWQELWQIVEGVTSKRQRAQVLLLMLRGVWFDRSSSHSVVRELVSDAISKIDFATKRSSELANRIIDYSLTDVRWKYDRSLGWVNGSPYSWRNPDVRNDPDRYRLTKRFFREL